jgi:hypothetical protein
MLVLQFFRRRRRKNARPVAFDFKTCRPVTRIRASGKPLSQRALFERSGIGFAVELDRFPSYPHRMTGQRNPHRVFGRSPTLGLQLNKEHWEKAARQNNIGRDLKSAPGENPTLAPRRGNAGSDIVRPGAQIRRKLRRQAALRDRYHVIPSEQHEDRRRLDQPYERGIMPDLLGLRAAQLDPRSREA